MRNLFFSFALLINQLDGVSQELSVDTLNRIESVFQKWNSNSSPGAAFAISRHGQIIYENAWGMADIEKQIPNTVSTVFPVASLSKQFTAAAVLLLEQQGKLSLDDDVRKYLPELHDFGKTITIRHLLNHTSGLRDWTNLLLLSSVDRSTTLLTNEYVLNFLSRQNELNNYPGDEFNYSNSNYSILPIVVQRVSGQSFSEFCRHYIFDLLHLDHTEWFAGQNKEQMAMPYILDKIYLKVISTATVSGHGGLMTTVSDLLTWNQAYLKGKLGGDSFLEKQLQPGRLNNGVVIPYAAGLRIVTYKGNKAISHNGVGRGYVSFLEYFPCNDMSFALAANVSEINPIVLCRQIEDLFIKPGMTADVPNQVITSHSFDALARFEGWYRNTRNGAGLQLIEKNGKLVTNSGDSLWQTTPRVFKVKEGILDFTSSSNLIFVNSTFYPDTTFYTRIEGPLDNTDIQEYAGSYFSNELNSAVSINVSGRALFMQLGTKKTYSLLPTYKDGFNIEPLITAGPNCLYFIRDTHEKIVGLRISIDRARNVLFERKN